MDGGVLKQYAEIPVEGCITPNYIKMGNEDWRLMHDREPDALDGIDLSTLSTDEYGMVFVTRVVCLVYGEQKPRKDSDKK